MKILQSTLVNVCKYGNAVIIFFIALYFFIIPGFIVTYNLFDPNIKDKGIPRIGFRLHRTLTPRYQQWARERIASGKASSMSASNVSGTEWPLFGSVFYLWATETLQNEWEKDNCLAPEAPKEYAREAIESVVDLIIDPNHATWVKTHWGSNYLYRENVFYRMLNIAALTEHYKLLGDRKYLPKLRDFVESLTKELDASPYGLLDDYPGECYPGDVLTAIACIRRADEVLGTDHSLFVKRALRGFQGQLLDERGLPPYVASSTLGKTLGTSQGCGNSYACLFSPEIWHEEAMKWYNAYEKYFWQKRWTAVGFREFPNDIPGYNWYMDVDSGPVLAGHGIAACAFGVGAARVNGRFDNAYPLTAEMLVCSWPLLDGTLLIPRILSDAADAPYLGETGILYNITRQPIDIKSIKTGGNLPLFVYLVLLIYFGGGILLIFLKVREIYLWRRMQEYFIQGATFQFIIWVVLVVGGALIVGFVNLLIGLLMLLCMQMMPRLKFNHKVNNRL